MATFQINKVLEQDYYNRLVEKINKVTFYLALVVISIMSFTYYQAISSEPEHIVRLYRNSLIFSILIIALMFFAGRFRAKLISKQLRIELKENSVRKFLDLSLGTKFEKAFVEYAKSSTDQFDIEIPFSNITSIVNKGNDVLIMTKRTNFSKTRNLIVLPIEIEQSNEIINIIKQKLG